MIRPLRAGAVLLFFVTLILHPAGALAWEGLPSYATESDLLATTPSTDDGAIGATFNPAQWGLLQRPEFAFFWSDANARPHRMDQWGFSAGQGLGLSLRNHNEPIEGEVRSVTDWQIGMGGGTREYSGGMAFGFSGPGKGAFERDNFLSFGDIARPNRWLSYGSTVRFALAHGDIDGVADLGVRPLGDPRLLLFADYGISRGDQLDEGALAGGVAIRPIPGLDAAARWGKDDRIQVTLGITLQRSGFRATPSYDRDGNLGTTHYVARLSPSERGIDLDAHANAGKRYVAMDLKGSVVYQAARYGDGGSIALWPLLQRLDKAAEDPTVGGVVLNISGLEANLTMMYEIREKLLALRARGKKVVLYADNMSGGSYYLASAADRLVMDPSGSMVIPGIQISRTYLKGTLEKLGIGFEEWRYFKYKSAMETFSRANMSPADKEQLQALTDGAYNELASGAVRSGRMTRDQFDTVVNDEPYLSAKRLLELHWVDELASPEDLKTIAKRVAGKRATIVSPERLAAARWQPDETWGPEPTVALVYAVGDCAMDSGIRARDLSKQLQKYRKDRSVNAVVIRADSPGGDPLASDLVAREIRALHKAKKPVLVSQGRVAASGGYWISMDGDTITTTPFTITASIGVIGGWAWNQGFDKKTGFTSDQVQRGRSADLLGGIRIPLLGATLPARNLSPAEKKVVEKNFFTLYDDFTGKVATARKLDVARVRELGEGHVVLGPEAIRTGLCDRIAGLDETIDAAKHAAKIPDHRKTRVTEYPKPPFIRLPGFLSALMTRSGARDAASLEPRTSLTYEARVLQGILDQPGRPLLFAPGTLLPAELETDR